MSNNDEEPYSSIFASLKHPVRRKILRMLSKKPMSYSEMLEVLGVSNSFLTYHLENLGELVSKMNDGKYRLSSFGEDAMATMTRVEDIPTTAHRQSPEARPKKIIWKSVPIALGLICIVLIAFIAYFAVAGISAQNSYNNLQNQNKQMQTWLDGNETLLNQTQANNTNLQNQIDSLNSNVINLQNQMNNFHIGSTENSTVWVNNESTEWVGGIFWGNYAPAAGYVAIQVSSNSNSTYVTWQISNIANTTYTNITLPIHYFVPEQGVSVGFGGTVVFPVPSSSEIMTSVGSNSAGKITVTITYYY